MVVTIEGSMVGPEIARYAAEYEAMYDTLDRFVVIMDIRRIDFPSADMFNVQKNLLTKLKHRSVSQVMGAVVFTEYESVKELIMALVKAGGQAAPFSIVTTVPECVHTVANWVQLIHRQTPTSTKNTGPLFVKTDPATIVAILVFRFIMFMRHFIRFEFTGRTR